jgi:hypothetical protein
MGLLLYVLDHYNDQFTAQSVSNDLVLLGLFWTPILLVKLTGS